MPDHHSLSLREQQLLFANHLRNPEHFPAPIDIEERRMHIYRRLFFGNIQNLLANTFPVICSILSDEQWQALVHDFYAVHRCETPLFPFIAGEFADYVLNESDGTGVYPFLAELAQYEWSETALRNEAVLRHAAVPETRVAAGASQAKPLLSPLCWPMVFRFPVHKIGKNCLPQQAPAEATFLLMYRDAGDVIRYIESNAATFRLLQLLQDDTLPALQDVCGKLASEMQHPEPVLLRSMVDTTIAQLLQAGVLLS